MPAESVMSRRADVRSWMIWLTAAMVYVLAMFHRASLGVASIEAGERFGIGAATLSTFTVLQLGVYAVMQVPTGVLVDRFGPRKVLTAALLFLGSGQLLIAVVHVYWLGLLARGVLGVGDALTFVAVLRLAANHFPSGQYALVTGLTGGAGFLGNLAATLPLALLLSGPGWLFTFLTTGVLTVLFTVVIQLRVWDTPGARHMQAPATSLRTVGSQVRAALHVPATRLGLWTHFTTPFGQNVMVLLWGVPFLVEDQKLTETTASSLIAVFVIGSMIGGPLVGAITGSRPGLRMPLVIGFLSATGVTWTILLGYPGRIPVAVLVCAFVVLSLGGPMSMIGFALARDYNPLPRVGTATGVVNMGGFIATTIVALSIGLLLQVTDGDFRLAFLSVGGVLLVGCWRIGVWWLRARREIFAAQARGETVPVKVRRYRWDLPLSKAEDRVPIRSDA